MPTFRRGPTRSPEDIEVKLDAIQPTLPLTHALLVIADDVGLSDVRYYRTNLSPPWFTGWLRLLDRLSIPRDQRRFLVKRGDNTLFAVREAETATWENLQRALGEVAAAARAAGGTVLLLFASRHDEQTQELWLPAANRMNRGTVHKDELKVLLEAALSDRGALVVFDSFGTQSGAPFTNARLRDADRIGVPGGGGPWTIERLPATRSQTPAPAFDAELLGAHTLSPLPVSWQVGSDHYLYANGTRPATLATSRADMDSPLGASLFLLSTQSSAELALQAGNLFGLLVAISDNAGFVTEEWTTQRELSLPPTFYAHRVQPETRLSGATWPLVERMMATEGLESAVVVGEGSGGATEYTLHLDTLKQAIGTNTTVSYVWSGFCPTDQRPRAQEAWYKVTNDTGDSAYCTGTAERPNFNRSSWWSTAAKPLDGRLLTFTRLKPTVRLPVLDHSSMELP